jgi:hypothetical protein
MLFQASCAISSRNLSMLNCIHAMHTCEAALILHCDEGSQVVIYTIFRKEYMLAPMW